MTGAARVSQAFRRSLNGPAQHIPVLLLIIGVTIALYAPMLGDFFQTDDFIFLRAARYADFPSYVASAFDFSGYNEHEKFIDFIRDDDIALPFLSYRPLYFVSLKVMNMAFGEDVTGYHAVSLGVHVVNVLLVWAIAARLLRGTIAPYFAAAIFALHPAYVPAIAWISDIGTLAATCFALLAFLLFMRSQVRWPFGLGWLGAAVAASVTSVLFHQETLPWTATIGAYAFLAAYLRGERVPFGRAWLAALPFLAIAGSGILLQMSITADTPALQESYGFGTHMITHFKNLAAGSVYPVVSENDAANLAAYVGLLVLLSATPLLWLVQRDRSTFFIALFCVLWFLASMAPLLTLDGFFQPGTLFRKLYVVGPSLAILLALAGQGVLCLVPAGGRRALAITGCVLVVSALAAGLHQAGERRDDVSEVAGVWQTYVTELRQRFPELPEGTTVYIVEPPEATRSLGDVYLVASAQAYYGRVDAVVVYPGREDNLKTGVFVRIFRYSSDN